MAAPLMAFQDPSQSAPGRSHNEGVQEINLNMVPTKGLWIIWTSEGKTDGTQ